MWTKLRISTQCVFKPPNDKGISLFKMESGSKDYFSGMIRYFCEISFVVRESKHCYQSLTDAFNI